MRLPSLFPEFFEIRVIRNQLPNEETFTDSELMTAILDPKNAHPPNPNLIFDCSYYKSQLIANAETRTKNPILHYLTEGFRAKLAPNRFFDPAYYREQHHLNHTKTNPVTHAINQLDHELTHFHPFIDIHYLTANCGAPLDRTFYERLFSNKLGLLDIHPLIDFEFFQSQTIKPFESLGEAFDAYWESETDLSTHILFDVEFYKAQLGVDEQDCRGVYHYLTAASPAQVHPLVDAEYYGDMVYQKRHELVDRPLEHYLAIGDADLINPSPYFDVHFYREMSGVKTNSLRHYIEMGHQSFSPHPLIDLNRWQTRLTAQGSNEKVLALEFRNADPSEVMDLVPNFDPVFYESKYRSTDPPWEHFFREGFRNGLSPNGLLSNEYIQNTLSDPEIEENELIPSYFSKGLHLRMRLVFSFASLEDTPGNRSWLSILAAQKDREDIEIIVLTEDGGDLVHEFLPYAHVWVLGYSQTEKTDFLARHKRFLRFFNLISSNKPLAALVSVNPDAFLLHCFASKQIPVLALIDESIDLDNTSVLEQVCEKADSLLFKTSVIQKMVAKRVDFAPEKATSGTICIPEYPGADREKAQLMARYDLRTALEVPKDALLVISIGNLDFFSGVDLFGCIAADYVSRPNKRDHVYFIWLGDGKKHPNTPYFYATHTMRQAGGLKHLLFPDNIARHDLLFGADLYLNTARNVSNMPTLLSAKAVGLPILTLANHLLHEDLITAEGSILVEENNLQSISDTLHNLLEDHGLRMRMTDELTQSMSNQFNFKAVVSRLNHVLEAYHSNLTLCSNPLPEQTEPNNHKGGSPCPMR